MTTIDSTRLREFAQAATPGPVELCAQHDNCDGGVACGFVFSSAGDVVGEMPAPADARLYVALRNALPELLEALELREACERLDAASGELVTIVGYSRTVDGNRWSANRAARGDERAPTLAALIVALGRP